MLDLDPIKARRDAATPGPWEVGDGPYFDQIDTVGFPHRGLIAIVDDEDCNVHGQAIANRNLIANTPTDIAALIEEVERVRAENEQLMLHENYLDAYGLTDEFWAWAGKQKKE